MRLAVLIACMLWLSSCGDSPERDLDVQLRLSKPLLLGLDNFTVVEIIPDGPTASLHWEAFDHRCGDALHVPFETLTIGSAESCLVVTTRGAGNDSLLVDGMIKNFDSKKQHLQIRHGSGGPICKIVPGGDYQSAVKWYYLNEIKGEMGK